MSKFGEPWVIDDATYCFNMLSSDGKIVDGDQEKMARAVALVNAMANVENPTEFMAEVRELLQDCATFVRERDRTDHDPDVRAQLLRNSIDAMLARLEPAGNQGRIEEPR